MNASHKGAASASPAITEQKLTVMLVDLAGYARACKDMSDIEVANFLSAYYELCAKFIEASGGRVVKMMGDACFAVYPEDNCAAAVNAAIDITKNVKHLKGRLNGQLAVGVNIHVASVAAGMVSYGREQRFDAFGSGVNHAFMMGGGAGIRLSEPAYRKLPSSQRSPWEKRKPPAIYHYAE